MCIVENISDVSIMPKVFWYFTRISDLTHVCITPRARNSCISEVYAYTYAPCNEPPIKYVLILIPIRFKTTLLNTSARHTMTASITVSVKFFLSLESFGARLYISHGKACHKHYFKKQGKCNTFYYKCIG